MDVVGVGASVVGAVVEVVRADEVDDVLVAVVVAAVGVTVEGIGVVWVVVVVASGAFAVVFTSAVVTREVVG